MKHHILLSLLVSIFFSNCQNRKPESKTEVIPGFFHNVYFFINPEATSEDIKKFEAGLIELGTIEDLIDYHIGKPAMTPRDVVDNSYQYAIISSFKDKAGQDAYQVHPIHNDFRALTVGIVDSVRIYDSLIE
jgi:hypothetical protein